jgi:hypothetical protein
MLFTTRTSAYLLLTTTYINKNKIPFYLLFLQFNFRDFFQSTSTLVDISELAFRQSMSFNFLTGKQLQ